MLETNRLKIYVASEEQMKKFIDSLTVDELKVAYTEMLNGSLEHKNEWEWYAIWMIELKDGTHIGELCFKGLSKDGIVEIGYGIVDEYQGKGYATEAVKAVVDWALNQTSVSCVKAETEESNIASQKVLEKAGFEKTGEKGKEGPIFFRRKNDNIILKYKFTLLYVLLAFLVGCWSIIDWKFGSEDPLWHLVFYMIILPVLSFVFGITALKEIKIWLIPLIVFASITIIWLVFENGGLTFSIEGLHIVSIPSIVASIVGIVVRKLVLKKQKM